MRRIEVIGKKIRKAREEKSLSISELAKAVGISTVYMSDIERGLRIFNDEETWQKLSEILDIELMPYKEYVVASREDSKEKWYENQEENIRKLEHDFGITLPADTTKEMADAIILRAVGMITKEQADEFFRTTNLKKCPLDHDD